MISGRKILTVSASLTVVALMTLGAVAPSQAQTVAGVTPGALSVGQSGAAGYSIPILVPPGTGGMAPSLSLNYGSQGGNGLLGVGWSLGGLSVIHRCPTTLDQDGFIDGVDYDANDKLCLDGQRLVATAGVYGADGTEYRTEIDGFAKIVSHGAVGAGPTSFTVWTKSGQHMEYGATADSRIEAQGRADARIWAVNEIADTVGNYLTVAYFEDNVNGEYRPTRIDYTGNDGAALAPNNSVRFVYETRSDLIELYAAGGKVRMTQRLAKVQTYEGASLVRDYRLTYDNGGAAGRSRVMSIKECDGAAKCLAPTNSEWPAVQQGFTQAPSSGSWCATNIQFGDFNGDGLTDLFCHTGSNSLYYVNLAVGDGPFTQAAGNGSWCATDIQLGDFNGDGLTDLFCHYTGTTQYYVNLATGDGSFTQAAGSDSWCATNIKLGDFNSDGLTDLFCHYTGTTQYYVNLALGDGSFTQAPSSGSWCATNIKLSDFDGDGLTDLFCHYTGTTQFYLNLAIRTADRLLASITDSLGAQTALTYKLITDSSVYTKGSGAAYPELDLQAPLYVVSQVSKDDGLGGQAVTAYSYGGAKAHLRGRGLLGFAWMAVTDQQSGIVTRTDYLQDFPYTGQVVASKTYMPDVAGEIPIKRLSNTWAVKLLNAGATQAPYVSASTAEAFEFNDGVLP